MRAQYDRALKLRIVFWQHPHPDKSRHDRLDGRHRDVGIRVCGQSNNGGCSKGGSGWLCFSGGSSGTTAAGTADPYIWDFRVVMPAGTLLATPSIKANYDSQNGWITPETIALPTSAGGLN
jgi:hypothetical protein